MPGKNSYRWKRNYNDFRDYCISNLRAPRVNEVIGKSGTDLGRWFIYQRRDVSLSNDQVDLMKSLLGTNWRGDIKYCDKYLQENINLHEMYPYLKDNGYDFSLVTLADKGIISKRDAVLYINKGITSMFQLYKNQLIPNTYKDIQKLISLPPEKYYTLYKWMLYKKRGEIITDIIIKGKLQDYIEFSKWASTLDPLFDHELKIVEMRLAGKTLKEIAQELDCSQEGVRIALIRKLSSLRQGYKIHLLSLESGGLENINIEDIVYTIFDKTNDIINCINAMIRKGYRTVKDYYPFISNARYPKTVYNRIEKAPIKGVGPKKIEILSKILWQIKKRYNL